MSGKKRKLYLEPTSGVSFVPRRTKSRLNQRKLDRLKEKYGKLISNF